MPVIEIRPTAPVLGLRPTQFDLGRITVAWRVNHLRELPGPELEQYIREHPVPIVIGPHEDETGTIGPALYMVDRHHFARVAYEMDIERLPIVLKHDFSNLSPREFWETMEKKKLVDLLDQFGNREAPSALAADVTAMPDSPARSVATVVRELKGYAKTKRPFGENKWARFFRANLTVLDINANFVTAVEEAMVLAKSPAAAAARLPGYRKPRQRSGKAARPDALPDYAKLPASDVAAPAAFTLRGASLRVERSAASATVKDTDVAKAALVAIRAVDDASRAAAIMADLKSPGLRAYRTSLRKLLTVLEMLDLAPGTRSTLTGMFSTAGHWRDAQVQAQWLGGAKSPDGSSPDRSKELARWRKQFEAIASELKPKLEAVAKAPAAKCKVLSEKVRRAILDQAAQASRRLSGVRDASDVEGLHSARLAIKRLGDLIEVFTGKSPGQVRALQDLLGGIHDRDTILHSLPSSAAAEIARAQAERRKLLDQLYNIE